jgi:glutathionylspermidine synthase
MERIPLTPRPDYGPKLEAVGLSFHSWDNYWKEDVCYRFTAAQVDEIEAAAETLHRLCVNAAKVAVAEGRLGQLGIPEPFWNAVATSLFREDFSLYGRFDLAYDGINPPKLLEYNADTPTSLLESAVAQWYWLEECFPEADQFNSLHERLVERWRQFPGHGPVHVASLRDNEEDWVCTTYLMDTLAQAGREARRINLEDIGWDGAQQRFVDGDNAPIAQLFKLYPWEWMMREDFGCHIVGSGTRFVEPLWKSILACKGLLPLLWELNPDHPNLLPAYYTPDKLQAYARKPFYSREGANVALFDQGRLLAQDDGPYGAEGFVYQALAPMPVFDGRYPVIGAWIVGDQAAGMCLREDVSPITTNMSHFVPHYFI